ncbi:GNAT family N-acetyltransferase [Silvanigrella aquatica]|uniref:N-acetyltransferase domain-containing protein n=1 Tax=Silvanigrella aquatica TaxID=1915309 RepID=A0A1L4D0G7_9BACT|nr:GNAT family N-acetyltransferase [Silvanigrella aquatica]APJ03689.1 hypothetical protein AXG55_07130 [Silvanigrella aquatica]
MELISNKKIESQSDFIFKEVFKNGLLNKYDVERVHINKYWEVYYGEFHSNYANELTFSLEKNDNSSALSNNLIVRDKNKIIAMFRSEEKEPKVYYMRHAVVEKNYRRQGIYEDYVDKIIKYAYELNYSKIISCFVSANNVAYKIKINKDFYITSLEFHPEFGSVVWITHFLNEELKRAFFYRCGMIEFTRKMFDNSEGNAKKLLGLMQDIRNY